VVTESKERGWAPIVGSVMAGIGMTFVAVFVLLWIDSGDAKIASQRILTIVAAVGVMAIAIIVLLLGVLLGQRGDRAMVSHVTGELGHAYRTMPPVIEGEARQVLQGVYKPPAALPQPSRIVNVPRYIVQGNAQPMNIELSTQTEDGDELKVPLPLLMRFLALNTPARSEWTGKREAYSEALRFCEAHGMLERTANGGARWRDEYPLASRREWAMQWEE